MNTMHSVNDSEQFHSIVIHKEKHVNKKLQRANLVDKKYLGNNLDILLKKGPSWN